EPHLPQAVTTRQKSLAVETAGRSNQRDLVAWAQTGRSNNFCRPGDLCVSQEILPGRSVVPDRAEKPCHPSSEQLACLQPHAPSRGTSQRLRRWRPPPTR